MNNSTKPLVAIRTIVYNHKPYLRDYFEGVIMQKTNFPFVAIVHDDCSTDGSIGIIREYAERYPDIIKPIYEEENQWSKHDGSLRRIMDEALNATGSKYIAMCEGDDYWTDEYKLQKQVDYLENHSNCNMCVHAAVWETEEGKTIRGCQHDNCDLSADEIIEYGGLYIALASTIYRREVFPYGEAKPLWWKMSDVGDYPLHIYAALIGKVHFMKDPMCVYRFQHPGSWTYNQSKEKDIKHAKCEIAWMELLDKETNYQYSKAILNHLSWFYILLYNENALSTRVYYKKIYQTGKVSKQKFVKQVIKHTFSPLYKIYCIIRYGN